MPGERKHTPLTSKAEFRLYATTLSAKEKGEPKPVHVPRALWNLSNEVLRFHLEEKKGKAFKKLPARAILKQRILKFNKGIKNVSYDTVRKNVM